MNRAEMVRRLTDALSAAIEGMAGERPSVKLLTQTDSGADLLWWDQPVSLVSGPAVFIGATSEAWQDLSRVVLTAAGLDEPEESDLKSTYIELVRQALGSLARDLTASAGTEVTCNGGSERTGPTMADSVAVEFSVGGKAGVCHFGFSPAMTAWGETQSGGATAGAAHGGFASETLERLTGLQLPLTVSLGRARWRLKDVLKLTVGSIIELNRTVTEPVEVIVNNCLVARGEVVVTEGNYGVRILEIVNRHDACRA